MVCQRQIQLNPQQCALWARDAFDVLLTDEQRIARIDVSDLESTSVGLCGTEVLPDVVVTTSLRQILPTFTFRTPWRDRDLIPVLIPILTAQAMAAISIFRHRIGNMVRIRDRAQLPPERPLTRKLLLNHL
jgi:hypothetical protein